MCDLKLVIEKNILDIITSMTNEETKKSISIDSKLIDTGIDSLTFISIITEIERELGVEFEDEKLLATEFGTIRLLIEYSIDLYFNKREVVK